MKASLLDRRLGQLPGLPYVTLIVLLLAVLLVSTLSSYDAEVRWLRFGSILLTVGIAMWLRAWEAAALGVGLSLVSGLLRGGGGDVGVLRWETLLEAAGLAATAVLTSGLRDQLARLTLPSAPTPVAAEQATAPAGQGQDGTRPGRLEPKAMTAVPSLVAFRPGESMAAYQTYLACLQLELTQTAQIIREVRSCGHEAQLESDVDSGIRRGRVALSV